MGNTRIIRPTARDRHAWDTVVTHPLQTWAWGEFRRHMGLDTIRLALASGGALVDGWQLTFHRVPYTPFTIGYFPKGPLPTAMMVDELFKLGKKKNAIFIQLEPNVFDNSKLKIPASPAGRENLKLRKSHHPLFPKYTFVLDLTKSEEQLMAAMHPKTRYNIRLAQKRGVEVVEDSTDAAFASYLALMSETTKRQQYFAHDERYHRRMWHSMHKAGIAHLFRASYQKQTIATWIIFVWNDTAYYPYGASSRNQRDVMAPNFLLWEIARWAKRHEMRRFDLWGALGPNPDVNDPWYGFHRFKESYAPELTEFIGSFDLVINKPLYEIYKLADSLRWRYLRLKSF